MSHPEDGSTLLEALVALTLLGVVVVGLLAGLGTAVLHSRIQDEAARVEAELRSFADSVLAASYVECKDGPAYGFTSPSGFTASASPPVSVDPATFLPSGTCLPVDTGLQLLRLTIRTADLTTEQSVTILKRAN